MNLLLRILAREASGYHTIETLFQRLALHDVVTVRVANGTRALRCSGPTMPESGLGRDDENLAWRAAAAYVHASGWETGWAIDIEKHIPVGGGLGGGSADAAAVLRALDMLSPTPLGVARLMEIGGTLGADIPFFVADTSLALAWGRGDRLLPLSPLPAMPVTLFTFAQGVNTGAAYGAFARAREARGEPIRAHAYAQDAFTSWQAIGALAVNDFESVVMALHSGVAEVLPQGRLELLLPRQVRLRDRGEERRLQPLVLRPQPVHLGQQLRLGHARRLAGHLAPLTAAIAAAFASVIHSQ
jgi:4-diphosphocytidyl-2-C-methyl-D-erythritol kinase